MHGEVVDVEAREVQGVEVFQVRRRQEHDHVPLGHEHHLACVIIKCKITWQPCFLGHTLSRIRTRCNFCRSFYDPSCAILSSKMMEFGLMDSVIILARKCSHDFSLS